MRVVGYIPKPRRKGTNTDSADKKKPEKAEEPKAEEAKEDSEA